LGQKKGADLLLATDLDADRLGAVVRSTQGRYVPLTGNQIGCLLLDYILSQRQRLGNLPKNGIMIKTVVTSDLGMAVASSYGVETVETLTGFKYIGEQIKERVDKGSAVFLFGYEESYGYLAGDFVRDKDGIQAALLVAEMAACYKSRGMTLLDVLERLYERYGCYREELVNLTLTEGEMDRVERIMGELRKAPFKMIAGQQVLKIEDYLVQTSTGLPSSNSLKYYLESEAWFCIRPSGTEPKIKIYFGVKEESESRAVEKLARLKGEVLKRIQ